MAAARCVNDNRLLTRAALFKMISLTVLSPHRDDAVFSLYLALRKWQQSPLRIIILNFFTQSNYAPRISGKGAALVSNVRKTEDHKALAKIGKNIQILDCDLLDAPLRLGIEAAAVCRPETRPDTRCVTEIAAYIRNLARNDLLLAPLSLGGHVDHRAVNEAAIASASKKSRLAFYEDLPYATWTPQDTLQRQVHAMEARIGIPLRPVIVRQRGEVRRKQYAAARYQSQITLQEAIWIARFSLRYGTGERLWIPKHGESWALLTR